MHTFTAPLEIIGVNPFVQVPDEVLADVFAQAGRSKGPIRVHGTVNGQPYQHGALRRPLAPVYQSADAAQLATSNWGNAGHYLDYNPAAAPMLTCPAFEKALAETPEAREVFERLSPSRQHEIVRYLARLKGEETLARNLERAVGFLLGKNRFVGRDRP